MGYEGKTIFSGYKLIEIFKNPAKYQRKNIKIKNLFNSIYEKIDNLKKMIEYKSSNTKLIELIQISKDLESKIKELKVYYILKNYIIFKNILIIFNYF